MTAPRSIAFLVFQSLRKGSYLHDGEISMLSGQLRARGVRNDVVETMFDHADTVANDETLGELAELLAARGYDVLVFHRIWDPAIPRRVRELLRERQVAPAFVLHETKAGGATDPYDCVLAGVKLGPLVDMARREGQLDVSTIPGVFRVGHDGELERVPGAPPVGDGDVPRWEQASNFARIRVNPEAGGQPPAVVIYGNPGCPYRRPVSTVPEWRRLTLDPETTNTRGCAFCDINLAEDWRAVPEIADHCVRQIQQVQADLPDAEEMILLDQDPFPFLPDLFRGLAEADARPIHLLIQMRADLFLKRTEQFEETLALARAGGHRLSPFLVGIENFHQPTLDFYNKGVTVETNVEVLGYLQDVGRRFPDVVDPEKMSPGFILWHPWVTMESLRANLDAIESAGLLGFRSEVVLSKIRLYPDIPFYWKAKEDGLLVETYGDRGFDSSVRYGYSEEHPYRFEAPEAQAAYHLLATLCREHEPIHELPLLRLVLDWVDGHPEYADADRNLAFVDPDGLRARFDAEHRDDVLALRKKGSGGTERDVTDEQRGAVMAMLGARSEDAPVGSGRYELARILRGGDRIQLLFAAAGKTAAVGRDARQAAFRLVLEPRSSAPHFMQTERHNLSYSGGDGDPRLLREIRTLCREIARSDLRASRG